MGTTYKARGRDAAIALGHDLVAADDRQMRIEAWLAATESTPGMHLYCARGGLRSKIAQEWLDEAGCEIARVAGGFKALRRACLDLIEVRSAELDLVVLGGRTGSGKTTIIKRHRTIDLEALANHRGSAFGAFEAPQPTTIDFENALAYELAAIDGPIVVEDESRRIGRLSIPIALFAAMTKAPVVVVEVPLDERVANIRREYVEAAQPSALAMRESLARIARRLGYERHLVIDKLMADAFASGNLDTHAAWIERLLLDYYDPMYNHQLEKKAERIVFHGTADAVDEFISARQDT